MTNDASVRVALYGTGRAAAALAHTLAPLVSGDIVLAGRRPEAAVALSQTLPVRAVRDAPALVAALDGAARALLVIAVTDDAIAHVAAMLAPLVKDRPEIAVVHLSGAQGLAPLNALEAQTARGFFHPLAALDAATPIAPNTVIGVGADRDTLRAALAKLATDAGLTPWAIAPEDAVQYHLAATTVANLPVALFAHATSLLTALGIPDQAARQGLATLMRSMVDNLATHSPAQALTGAVARGDARTVERHLRVLAGDAPAIARYRDLSRALVQIATLSDAKREALLAVLADDEM